MSKPRSSNIQPNSKTLAKIDALSGDRSFLAALTPEERATLFAVRRRHHDPERGRLNITKTLRALYEDFGEEFVSLRTFGDWIRQTPGQEKQGAGE